MITTVLQIGETVKSHGVVVDLLARDAEAVAKSVARLQQEIERRSR